MRLRGIITDQADSYAGGFSNSEDDRSKALELNEDLVEAIALGHDLGHTPFGHASEAALDAVCPDGFAHYRQSVGSWSF